MDGDEALLGQLRRGVVAPCVLALLRDEERYGYDLVVALSEADEETMMVYFSASFSSSTPITRAMLAFFWPTAT